MGVLLLLFIEFQSNAEQNHLYFVYPFVLASCLLPIIPVKMHSRNQSYS